MFIAVLFTIAKIWKQPKCLLMYIWIKEKCIFIQWNIDSHEKEGHLSFCNSMEKLESIMQSKIILTKKSNNV